MALLVKEESLAVEESESRSRASEQESLLESAVDVPARTRVEVIELLRTLHEDLVLNEGKKQFQKCAAVQEEIDVLEAELETMPSRAGLHTKIASLEESLQVSMRCI